jgi:hypothetical protein
MYCVKTKQYFNIVYVNLYVIKIVCIYFKIICSLYLGNKIKTVHAFIAMKVFIYIQFIFVFEFLCYFFSMSNTNIISCVYCCFFNN